MNKLKPCPFCGGEAVISYMKDDPDTFRVSCEMCWVSTSWENQETAIADWNDRVAPADAWISVEERLPEPNERVLIYRPYMEDADTGPISVQWGWTCKREASHWMPLPSPPREEEADE